MSMFLFTPACCCGSNIPCLVCLDAFNRGSAPLYLTDINSGVSSGCLYTNTTNWSIYTSGNQKYLVTSGNNSLGLPVRSDGSPSNYFMTSKPFTVYSGLAITVELGDYNAEFHFDSNTGVYVILNGPLGVVNRSALMKYPVGFQGGSEVANGLVVGMTNVYTRPTAWGTPGSHPLAGLVNINTAEFPTLGDVSTNLYMSGDYRFFAGFYPIGGPGVLNNPTTDGITPNITFDGGRAGTPYIVVDNSGYQTVKINDYLSTSIDGMPAGYSNINLTVAGVNPEVRFSGLFIGKTGHASGITASSGYNSSVCAMILDDCKDYAMLYDNATVSNNRRSLGYSMTAIAGSFIEEVSTFFSLPGEAVKKGYTSSTGGTLQCEQALGWPVLNGSMTTNIVVPTFTGTNTIRIDYGYNDEGAEYFYAQLTYKSTGVGWDGTFPHEPLTYSYQIGTFGLYSSVGGTLMEEQVVTYVSSGCAWQFGGSITAQIRYANNIVTADIGGYQLSKYVGVLTGKARYRKIRVRCDQPCTIAFPMGNGSDGSNPTINSTMVQKLGYYDGSPASVVHGMTHDELATTVYPLASSLAGTGLIECGISRGPTYVGTLPESISITLAGFDNTATETYDSFGNVRATYANAVTNQPFGSNIDGDYELVRVPYVNNLNQYFLTDSPCSNEDYNNFMKAQTLYVFHRKGTIHSTFYQVRAPRCSLSYAYSGEATELLIALALPNHTNTPGNGQANVPGWTQPSLDGYSMKLLIKEDIGFVRLSPLFTGCSTLEYSYVDWAESFTSLDVNFDKHSKLHYTRDYCVPLISDAWNLKYIQTSAPITSGLSYPTGLTVLFQ